MKKDLPETKSVNQQIAIKLSFSLVKVKIDMFLYYCFVYSSQPNSRCFKASKSHDQRNHINILYNPSIAKPALTHSYLMDLYNMIILIKPLDFWKYSLPICSLLRCKLSEGLFLINCIIAICFFLLQKSFEPIAFLKN